MVELLKPYRDYEAILRLIYAQDARNSGLKDSELIILPFLTDDGPGIQMRARDLTAEFEQHQKQFIMPLADDQRQPDASPAVVKSLKDFQRNYNVFSGFPC